MAPHFLTTWRLAPHGVIKQGGMSTGVCAWTAIESLTVDEAHGEITLHLDVRFRGNIHRLSLTCLRSEVTDEALSVFNDAVSSKRLG